MAPSLLGPIVILLSSTLVSSQGSFGNPSKFCYTPPAPKNGEVMCDYIYISEELKSNYLCVFTCDDGYRFDGIEEDRISKICYNGTYGFREDPTTPPCVPRCIVPDLPANVTASCVDKPNGGKSCVVACSPGFHYISEPAESYVCKGDGKWLPDIATAPQCLPDPLAVISHDGQALCAAWGQSHYRTFDNKIFTFQGTCKYVLAYVPNYFEIMTVNDKICVDGLNCTRDIEIYFNDNVVRLRSAQSGPIVEWNERRFNIPGSRTGTVIERVGSYVTVKSPLQFTLKWDGSQSVFITVSDNLKGKVSGLCGRYNGNPRDDFENASGKVVTSVSSFGNSWKKTKLSNGPVCLDLQQTSGCSNDLVEQSAQAKCGDLLTDPAFKLCHSVVDPQPYVEACKTDCCSADSAGCMCETMQAYSRACVDLGVRLSWRNPGRCEIQCDGGKVFKECGSSCIEDCSSASATCSDPTCIDGCFCPDGYALHNGVCIQKQECPCTLTAEQGTGKEYQQGHIIKKECNTCTCKAGQWDCTHQTCDKVCSASGDPHYTTFDGVRFDFMGMCSYYMVKNSEFDIIVNNVRCGHGGSSCTKSVTIDIDGSLVNLDKNHQLVVDGREVSSLPFARPGIQVSMVSSLFMQAKLYNGITVLWDGRTRAYIKAPPSMMNKTRGLCGTYDGKQSNDFITPQGIKEYNTNLFGNQWKTDRHCADIGATSKTHPCDSQAQRLAQAKSLCGYLKNQTFQACHDVEDVDLYYEDCMYDLCACTQNLFDCLCPTLGIYADTCAAKGVLVNWRDQVSECQLKCPGGQHYQVCGRPCERTCRDLAANTDDLCDQKCVEGCNCPDGQSLNNDGECVPVEECPCIFDGREYPAGHTSLKGTDICVCAGAQWQCHKVRYSDHRKLPFIKPLCPANMEYNACPSNCPLTCENMDSPSTCDVSTCTPGCACIDGYVLDGDKCVKESMCPCQHGGKSYYEGDSLLLDCNECVCRGQVWQCEDNECPATCSAYGDSHYSTFDELSYEFQGSCDYILAQSADNNPDKFVITTKNVQCGTSGVTCSKGIDITLGRESTSSFYRLKLERGKISPPGLLHQSNTVIRISVVS
ncbi:SCO-spondin-like [Aplysia californica]|uniref:SCO-spondin-like n=1 Tax=Aplysia californica TaxID=6500 RepID=A0ABM1VNP8_APLCA|nr:SCO-spondin-like [Aplysia californica]